MKALIFLIISVLFITPVSAAEVPRESVALYLTEDCVIVAENLISDVLTEVQNGLGFSDARAK